MCQKATPSLDILHIYLHTVNENEVLSYCEALRCETLICFPLCQAY